MPRDASELAHRLAREAEAMCRHYLSNGKREGRYWLVGYSWFGNQAAQLGGFPLLAYLNWQAGVTFTYKAFNLDLRYYDTNLSKENCYVFTGDQNARPGGRVDPITNPAGLVSNCNDRRQSLFAF